MTFVCVYVFVLLSVCLSVLMLLFFISVCLPICIHVFFFIVCLCLSASLSVRFCLFVYVNYGYVHIHELNCVSIFCVVLLNQNVFFCTYRIESEYKFFIRLNSSSKTYLHKFSITKVLKCDLPVSCIKWR